MSAIVGLLMIPWTVMLRGLVLSVLWRWFVVDAFHVAPLSIPGALGISMIVALLTQHVATEKAKDVSFAALAIGGILSSAFALLAGWIYKAFL